MLTQEQFLELLELFNQSNVASHNQGLHVMKPDYEEKRKISLEADSQFLQYLQSLVDFD